LDCINVSEFIKNIKKDLSKTRVYCPECKKWGIKFRIEKNRGEYYYLCPKHVESSLEIKNDVLSM
tara:strand:+ start:156 stop:350 length:195 start_codon:yes stop_codon:yes gene_type:complete